MIEETAAPPQVAGRNRRRGRLTERTGHVTENELWYWLQGFFELGPRRNGSDDETGVGPHRAAIIQRHIALVVAPSSDLIELRAIIRLAEKANSIEEAQRYTNVIREAVGARFEHVIDPSAGGPEKQAQLNAAHGTGTGPGRTMRC